ncbi:MAG TPA: DegV family protein [Bellilinea sp.]|nr:DegV family protein [Bellilinea sp.]
MDTANCTPKTITDPEPIVAIEADSVAQVPAEMARQLDITVIPFTVSIDGQLYLDGIDLAPKELYRRMRLENIMPTTAAPSLGQYQQTFETCLHAGAQAVLYVALSSKLSGGYSTACQAAKIVQEEFPDRIVEVLESQQATISQGFVVMAAARAAAQGKPLAEVRRAAEEAKRHVGFAATLETLEYLARGGRIGKAAYMLGNLIKINPILTIKDGQVTPVSRVRGENHAMQAIVDYVARQAERHRKLHLAIMEADAPDQAARLQELALQQLQPAEIFHSEFTPVMGVHTGPGLVGLGYYYE